MERKSEPTPARVPLERLMCLFGLHRWFVFKNGCFPERICFTCGRRECLYPEGPDAWELFEMERHINACMDGKWMRPADLPGGTPQ